MSTIVDLIDEWAENSGISPFFIGGNKEEIERYAPAIIGVTDGYWTTDKYNDRVAVVYDEAKMIEIIAEDMEPMGDPDNQYNDVYFIAREHFDFNIKGARVGEHTPIFINTFLHERQVKDVNLNIEGVKP